ALRTRDRRVPLGWTGSGQRAEGGVSAGRQLLGCLATRRQPVHPGGAKLFSPPPPFPPLELSWETSPFPGAGSPRGALGPPCPARPLQPAPRAAARRASIPRVELHPLAPMPGREESSGCPWLELCRCSQVASAATAPGAVKFYARKSQGLCVTL
ncbi:unnamed protein product, partial [Gulo gulo]